MEERRGEASHITREREMVRKRCRGTHQHICGGTGTQIDAHIEWHTRPGGVCVIAVCLTRPCVCCLDMYASLSPQHTHVKSHIHREKNHSFFSHCQSLFSYPPIIPVFPQLLLYTYCFANLAFR